MSDQSAPFSEWAMQILIREGVREALGKVADKVEQHNACDAYRKAMKIAAKLIRDEMHKT